MTKKAEFFEMFEDRLKSVFDDISHPLLRDAMKYSVMNGGKRVRPYCVYLGAKGISDSFSIESIIDLGIAFELVHSYSLVHDDLPSMDNDEFRRGQLTTHKKFGEASAILCGDQLLTIAFKYLLDCSKKYSDIFITASQCLSLASKYMVEGQMLDMQGMKTKEEFLDMYEKKTGAMIVQAFVAGAVMAGADKNHIEDIYEFGKHIGLGFQIADDLLDFGECNSLVAVVGKQESIEMLKSETTKAVEAADKLNNSDEMILFAKKMQNRTK